MKASLLASLIIPLATLYSITFAQDSEEQVKNNSRLFRAKSLVCSINNNGNVGAWIKGSLQILKADDTLNLVLDSIDFEKSEAFLTGNNQRVRVVATQSLAGATFIEAMPNGSMTFLSVFPIPTTKENKEVYPAAYSRHIMDKNKLSGLLIAASSQYHGTCKVDT